MRFETAKAKHDCSLSVQLDSVFPNLQVAKKFKSNKFMITGLISTAKWNPKPQGIILSYFLNYLVMRNKTIISWIMQQRNIETLIGNWFILCRKKSLTVLTTPLVSSCLSASLCWHFNNISSVWHSTFLIINPSSGEGPIWHPTSQNSRKIMMKLNWWHLIYETSEP